MDDIDNIQDLDDSVELNDGKITFSSTIQDPAFLAAKGRFPGNAIQKHNARELHISKLTKAILRAMENHGYVKIRSIGSQAHANALYAMERASRICEAGGVGLYWEIVKDHGNIGELRSKHHVANIDALVFSLATFKKEE